MVNFFRFDNERPGRDIFILSALLGVAAVSACTTVTVPEPEIVSGTADEVTIQAGVPANPGPLATQYCAKYGKEAKLRESELIDRGSTTMVYLAMFERSPTRIYYFNCVR